jgi:hypothetical protein
MLLWVNLTLQHMRTIHSPFSGQLITCNFCSVPTVFHWCFTWVALGDVHLCFSLMVTKASAVEGELHQPCVYIINIIYLYTWLMAWQWHHFLLASNTRQKWPQIMYATLCYTKHYPVKLKSHASFKVTLKWNHAKRNSIKWDLQV